MPGGGLQPHARGSRLRKPDAVLGAMKRGLAAPGVAPAPNPQNVARGVEKLTQSRRPRPKRPPRPARPAR